MNCYYIDSLRPRSCVQFKTIANYVSAKGLCHRLSGIYIKLNDN